MKLTIDLAQRSYELWFGNNNLKSVGEWLESKWSPRQVVVISDETVAALYGSQVLESLNAKGFLASMVTIKPGEESKSLTSALRLYDYLTEKNMTRSDGIVLLGGGVVGDLGGFVASTYMRGIPFVQIPTTLLAQVDSSIGGKTAVNTLSAKNIVGTFAQPQGVLIDVSVLESLQGRQISEGLAEIIKMAAIADLKLWQLLLEIPNKEAFLNNALPIIYRACQVKKQAVEKDEFDTNERLLLNFGHTLGHAIEQTQGYGVITHGEAVAIGMVKISQLSEELGLTSKGVSQELSRMLSEFSLPVTFPNEQQEKLLAAIKHDKKARGDQLQLIVLKEIGSAFIYQLSSEKLATFLEE